jgi:hypothetical protein
MQGLCCKLQQTVLQTKYACQTAAERFFWCYNAPAVLLLLLTLLLLLLLFYCCCCCFAGAVLRAGVAAV